MIIDVHAHYVSPTLLDRATGPASPVGLDVASGRLVFPTGYSRPIPESLIELAERIDWMDSNTIDLQVLSPWMDIVGVDLAADEQVIWCRMYNDAVASDLEQSSRFRGLAALPASNAEASAGELQRAVDELGFVGGAIPTQIGDGIDLDAAGLDPLFEAAESLKVPLFVHPFKVMARRRMDHHFLFNVCGNPFETTLAALRLFFSGVFEAWPYLRLLLAHVGGTLPLVAGRAVHASKHAVGFETSLAASTEILHSFYYDTILHDSKALAFALEVIGPQRLALGSDYPFPMRLGDPLEHLRQASKATGLPNEMITQVADQTPREVFGM